MTNQRLPDLEPDALTPEQRAAYDAIAAGPRGAVEGPLRVWVRNPGFADRAQALGQYARYDSSLPPVLSELAILVTARLWSSGFEWNQHAPIAAAAGVSAATIDAIGHGRRPQLADVRQQAVFEFSVELHRDRRVSDAVFRAACDHLGTEGVIDLVGICGYYTLISMTINAFQVSDDAGPPLPQTPLAPGDMFR